jgi:hypothetical protein
VTLRRCRAGVKGQVAGREDRCRAWKRRRGIRTRLERLGDVIAADTGGAGPGGAALPEPARLARMARTAGPRLPGERALDARG